MKSLIAFSISVITFVGMSTAFAAQPAKTEIRNDRVTVKKTNCTIRYQPICRQ